MNVERNTAELVEYFAFLIPMLVVGVLLLAAHWAGLLA